MPLIGDIWNTLGESRGGLSTGSCAIPFGIAKGFPDRDDLGGLAVYEHEE